jgi:hypothetical protein
MNWRQSVLLSTLFAVLTALGIFIFPGHTFLQSDTQIYLPLFEHLKDQRLLTKELILSGAHLSYTIYDETTLTLSRLFSLNFEQSLLTQQAFFRWLGYWGAFWLARACGLSLSASILTSALLWLGAFVYGPAVITTEFEPVPRGFAVPLVVACLGALAQGYKNTAATCLALAFLYHAPAVWPILAVALYRRHWRLLAFTALSAAILLSFASSQRGIVEAQPFFSLIEPNHRAIMQARAAYNWISLWPPRHWLQFLLTGALALAAFYRTRHLLPGTIQPYFQFLPLIGLATMPLSYLLLEQLNWALFPQIQPMRALLYCHLLCQLLGTLAAWQELKDNKPLRAFAWLIVPLTLSLRGDFLQLPTPQIPNHLLLLTLLAAAIFVAHRWPRPHWALATCLALPLLFGEVFEARAYTTTHSPALNQLADWASTKTPIEAVFFFPDLGRRQEPGIFRARAARAVYVCWKQGGQVNYFPRYAEIWWERWTSLLAPNHPPHSYDDLRRRGIQYLVFTKDNPTQNLQPVYLSPTYRVYAL